MSIIINQKQEKLFRGIAKRGHFQEKTLIEILTRMCYLKNAHIEENMNAQLTCFLFETLYFEKENSIDNVTVYVTVSL